MKKATKWETIGDYKVSDIFLGKGGRIPFPCMEASRIRAGNHPRLDMFQPQPSLIGNPVWLGKRGFKFFNSVIILGQGHPHKSLAYTAPAPRVANPASLAAR